MSRIARVAAVAAALVVCSAAASANADTVAVAGPTSGTTGATGSAPGFGTTSWQETGPGKSEYYVSAAGLFGHNITISQIASISWWTNKPGVNAITNSATDVDWFVAIYTALQGTGNTGSFYHSRLNSEPYFSNGTYTPDAWKQWSSNDPTAPLRFFDQPRSGNFGTYADPTLSAYTTGTSFPNGHDYRNEQVSLFSMQTGSAWSAGFTGKLDGLTVTLVGGETASVNFEATAAAAAPLPPVAWSGIALLGGLGASKLRRRRAMA